MCYVGGVVYTGLEIYWKIMPDRQFKKWIMCVLFSKEDVCSVCDTVIVCGGGGGGL